MDDDESSKDDEPQPDVDALRKDEALEKKPFACSGIVAVAAFAVVSGDEIPAELVRRCPCGTKPYEASERHPR